MPEVFVALGSNVEPERHLQQALSDLEKHFGSLRRSAIYRSPAVGSRGADFLNAVVAFRCVTGPDAVKEILRAVEDAAGRSRSAVKGRSCEVELDLDLLLYGGRVDSSRRLPRVDILQRAFVLAPLAQLAPELAHPVTGESLGAAWRLMAETEPALTEVESLRS